MENSHEFLIEVLKQYGIIGVIFIILLLGTFGIFYKYGDQIYSAWRNRKTGDHYKRMMHGVKKGPLVHSTLREFAPKINCDHIFIAEFHNGTTSITGIPYMKLDVIFEHISPRFHANDCLLVRLYENEYIQTHDQLPGVLFQNNYIHYTIDELEYIDEQLYFRMKSREISSIAMSLIYNTKGIPVGLVGCFNFDIDKKIDNNELKKCSKEIENIYNK